MADPRHFQIAVLVALLAYGLAALDFAVTPMQIAATLAAALGAEWIGRRATGSRGAYDPRSPLITGLSLCLLLRVDAVPLAALAGALGVGSKFLVRARGRHLFNPSAFAIAALLCLSERAWVSPGQWGHTALYAGWVVCIGAVVVQRAQRSDVTWAFALSMVALEAARAVWLGDPAALVLHRLESGSLLLFTFFMISDPKTTPDSRAGRIVFAVAVAGVALVARTSFYATSAPIWALIACAPLVPLIDSWPSHRASRTRATRPTRQHGDSNALAPSRPLAVAPLPFGSLGPADPVG